ncbi:MAG TPA: AbrB/MazE/SpoVT family DNA-binding domain-containing protein [Candidatus Acidoferrales bacterium]|jgi:AbrB family looped-hinge helix DNA binding protein|nr:AbrB/MazE/SpoVT family DNA-binding domain-containing protein [Candidatus Acidoferrales bacterium]
METTRLSTKGQIVLPKSIRTPRSWEPGTEFTVEETPDGILLRPAGYFRAADLNEVAGCLRSKRKAKTSALSGASDMRAAIGREVNRRHDSGRY